MSNGGRHTKEIKDKRVEVDMSLVGTCYFHDCCYAASKCKIKPSDNVIHLCN